MLARQLLQALIQAKTGLDSFTVEIPKSTQHGDYATNAAFILAKQRGENPAALAKQLASELASKEIEAYAIGPFINFKLTDQALTAEVMNIGDDYGASNYGNDRKILLEFVSANPTGPLHIGHGRWAVIGDVLARMQKRLGYAASTEFYINDAGNQINNLRLSVEAVRNGQEIPADGYHGAYIKDLAVKTEDPVEVMLKEQQVVLAKLGVTFDTWFREKTLHEAGEVQKVRDYLDVYEKDGALWLKTMDHGDDKDRVLIKATGEPTYFAADIAYHHNKLERGFKELINIWGADHHGYVARMQIGLKTELDKHQAVLKIIIGQLVNLFRNGEPVRMSKRTGEMITLDEVMEEIGVDATRYFMARYSPDTAIDFDLELAKKQSQDNPVFYVQYAHARICSILRNAVEQGIDVNTIAGDHTINLIADPHERALAKKLVDFPEELIMCTQNYQPYQLAAFAEELAALFHAFYHNCRVISPDQELTKKRLVFVQKTKTVLGIILEKLLGIKAPERM
ncbi:MAG: arginine--tRNA ligase [Candidatus Margulisiibacteriota bacterium]|jgi:arginyl-tRNA synthetase